MNVRFLGVMALAIVAAGLSLAPVPVAGQGPSPGAVAPRYAPPRTPDGQPDLQGYWAHRGSAGMATYSLEGGDNEEHLFLSSGCAQGIDCSTVQRTRNVEPRPRVSVLVDPPDQRVSYQPWAAAKKREIIENHTNPQAQHLDPMARCFLTGVPRATYQEYAAFQIIQTPGYVVMSYEFLLSHHPARRAPAGR